MIVDSLASVPIAYEVDSRVKKKNEEQDLRSIEEPDQGNNLELDLKREEPPELSTSELPAEEMDIRGKMYGAGGKLLRDREVEQNQDYENTNIDLIV